MTYYRLAVALAVGALLFLVLGIGALGIIGDGRDDQVYVSVLAVAVICSAVARLRPHGMALAFLATAFAQVLVSATALLAGLHDNGGSIVDILGLTGMYAGLFCVTAWLFWRAAEQSSTQAVSARV
jgi:hypothetical protein